MTVSAVLDFDAFVRSSYGSMIAKAVMVCGSKPDAEDATQEAYLQAFRYWDRISGYDSAEGWVYRVMCQRLWRRAAVAQRSVELVGEQADDGVSSTVDVLDVLDALARLPPGQRVVVILCCLHGFPQAEVADLLDVRRSTVAAHLFKARGRLRELLAVDDGAAGSDGRLLSDHWTGLAALLAAAQREVAGAVSPYPSWLPL